MKRYLAAYAGTFMPVFAGASVMYTPGDVSGAQEKGVMAGVAIGGVAAFAAMPGGPVSGASMNPARSLGSALVSGEIQALWIYLLAPVGGALPAIPRCRCVREPSCCGRNV